MLYQPFRVHGGLPVHVSPSTENPDERDPTLLCQWLGDHPVWVQDQLAKYGALLFRGFDIHGPDDFEAVARAIDDELKNHYLGTSPRNALTEYVFNASELPDYYPIPQHCEMTFCAHPPRRVFFCCLEEPRTGGGETPLCDFRKVWSELDPRVRERFLVGGLRIIRNYAGPAAGDQVLRTPDASSPSGPPTDPTQLKPWPDMFGTTDKAEVEAQCLAEGFEPIWLAGDALRLVSTQPVTIDHPFTHQTVWYNHLTTFHVGTGLAEYTRIAKLRPTPRHQNMLRMAEGIDRLVRAKPPEERGMHVTYLDGSEILEADIEAVRDAVWKHMSITPWKQGDIIAIDNQSTAHGRLPYEGPRHIAVCWA